MKTAIVMGNGPSLLKMPVALLAKYDSFGVNYCPFRPTHYVCIDTLILTRHTGDIYPIARAARHVYLNYLHAKDPRCQKLYTLPGVQLVSRDKDAFREELYLSGYNVAYVALKMAYYAGYERILLWGVDLGADWKHYRDDYPTGIVTTRKSIEVMKFHLNYADEVYRAAGRQILNFSEPSRLKFERGSDEQIL